MSSSLQDTPHQRQAAKAPFTATCFCKNLVHGYSLLQGVLFLKLVCSYSTSQDTTLSLNRGKAAHLASAFSLHKAKHLRHMQHMSHLM